MPSLLIHYKPALQALEKHLPVRAVSLTSDAEGQADGTGGLGSGRLVGEATVSQRLTVLQQLLILEREDKIFTQSVLTCNTEAKTSEYVYMHSSS